MVKEYCWVVRCVMNQGPNLMNLRYVAELLTAGSIGSLRLRKDLNQCMIQIWTGR